MSCYISIPWVNQPEKSFEIHFKALNSIFHEKIELDTFFGTIQCDEKVVCDRNRAGTL